MGVLPVTQDQWQTVMGSNPSCFCGSGGGQDVVAGLDTSAFPVEQVSWEDALAFLEELAALKQEREAGRGYRLAGEAEWEYSCRAGTTTAFHYGNSLSSAQANFYGDHPYGGAGQGPYLRHTCKVGSYQPNSFGLYDMHGNVAEWCQDRYDPNYYKASPRRDPQGPARGSERVFRGGCWGSEGRYCRSATRAGNSPHLRINALGFRAALVLSAGQ
jgi:formylglycine-generating enzyme required for sulfatase activity